MLTTTKSSFSAEYLRNELAGLGFVKNAGKLWLAIPLILSISFALNILLDIEYAGQDLLVRGPRIFSWLKTLVSPQASNSDDDLQLSLPLFADDKESIEATVVRQNGVYDCRFLAALASFAATERGKETIFNMIRRNKDGSFTVTFPEAKSKPITVTPLSTRELDIYSRAVDKDGFSAGIWVPVIEKAYGTYLDQRQSFGEKCFHFVRHGIMDGRWTSSPELPGFAASYGARDERGCKALTGNDMNQLTTTSFELGDFGLGKGYVTERQMESWFNRSKTEAKFYDEQDKQLKEAFKNQRIVLATTGVQEKAEAYGLMEHHAYAIVGYDATNSRIVVRDVLNKSHFVRPETEYKFKDSDLSKPFSMTLPEFNSCFSGLSIERQK
ncbi:MAG: hypothetical protein JST89_08645 [Cyanobacteria bacterium SZAS-4]|nr:hypothetical protein [Cyanobacteria bacterium SZAS-4]